MSGLVLVWLGWCLLHSGLIAAGPDGYFQRRLGRRYRYFRLFYNILSLVTLALALGYTRSLGGPALLSWQGHWRFWRWGLLGLALLLFYLGGRRYDLLHFLGFRQLAGGRGRGLGAGGRLDTGGILGALRHPWYLGGSLIVWMRELSLADLVANVFIVGYFVGGAWLEERKLVREFGEEYRRYQREVSMFIPLKWLRARMGAWFGARGRLKGR